MTEWWGEGDRRRAFGLWESEDGGGWYIQTIDVDTGLPQWESHEALLDDARKAARDYAESWTRKLVEAVSVAEYRGRAHGQSKGGRAKGPFHRLAAEIARYLTENDGLENKELWSALKSDQFLPAGYTFHQKENRLVHDDTGKSIGRRTFDTHITVARRVLRGN